MNGKKQLETILNHLDVNINRLAESLDISKQILYDIKNGKIKSLSKNLINAISEKYPEINKNWLLTGEGDMIIINRGIVGKNIVSSSGDVVVGTNNTISKSDAETTEKLLQQQNDSHSDYKESIKNVMDILRYELQRFHEAHSVKDEYVKDVIHKSYVRNEKNSERYDILMSQLIEVIKQNGQLIESINNLSKK